MSHIGFEGNTPVSQVEIGSLSTNDDRDLETVLHSQKVLLPSWLLHIWLTWLPSWTLFPSTCDGCVHTTWCGARLMASAWISALTATVISFDATNGLLLQMKKERGEEGGGEERDTKTWDRKNRFEVDRERETRKHRNKHKKESDPRCESNTEPQHKWNGEITYLLSGSPAWIGEEVECCCHGIAGCMLLRLVCNHHWCSHSPSLPLHLPYPELFSSFTPPFPDSLGSQI